MALPIIAGAVVSLVQILGWNSITVLHDDADDDLGNYYFRQVILLHINNRHLIWIHDLTESGTEQREGEREDVSTES